MCGRRRVAEWTACWDVRRSISSGSVRLTCGSMGVQRSAGGRVAALAFYHWWSRAEPSRYLAVDHVPLRLSSRLLALVGMCLGCAANALCEIAEGGIPIKRYRQPALKEMITANHMGSHLRFSLNAKQLNSGDLSAPALGSSLMPSLFAVVHAIGRLAKSTSCPLEALTRDDVVRNQSTDSKRSKSRATASA